MDDLAQPDNTADYNAAKIIDEKLRSILENKTSNNLPFSLFLADMYRNSMYKKLGHKSMRNYIKILSEDTGNKYARIRGWFNIGQIYLSYEDHLMEAGFSEKNGLTKLRFLKKALEKHEKEDVYQKLLTLSYDDFSDYARNVSKTYPDNLNKGDVENAKPENIVFTLNGKIAITINREIAPENFSYLVRVCQYAIKAIKKGEKILYLSVKNNDEYDRFESALKKLIRQLRRKSIGK